ncbi:hypothetical protein DB88DRAFT_360056 [Papiliotrema laurentii]|uniref:Uncharacterized protein n=1 Tax=Papiliotrema laurentii TaxID=5418 RepID=A0AAD9CXJ1_PAPLA|nr:hypothetical protein DB88DRAFT_360056 [Papiliotrema laurentii]
MLLTNLLVLLALPIVLAQGPIADGGNCTADNECQSRNCNVPPVGPGDKQCLPRPGVVNSPCLKDLQATDCTTGFCNDQGRCARVPPGETCKEDNDCDGNNVICRVTPFKTQVCLETNLPEARACALNEQCQVSRPFVEGRRVAKSPLAERPSH